MNRKTIQKVIDELNKPQPRLDYVKGILETIIEGLPEENTVKFSSATVLPPTHTYTAAPSIAITDDEGSLLDAEARAKLAKVQALAQESNV